MKNLPCKIMSKKKVVEMNPGLAEKDITSWIRDIQERTRGKYYNKNAKNLSLREWVIFLHEFDIPPGYSDVFTDGETVWEKFKRIPKDKWKNTAIVCTCRNT